GARSNVDEKWREIFSGAFSETVRYRLEIFSWLCNRDYLEIRYASRSGGMYHKKIGILEDDNEDKIVFSGSMNLTRKAIISNEYNPQGNSEEFSVYPSWIEDCFHNWGKPKVEDFERAWEGYEPNTTIAKMPSEHYERIKKHYPNRDLPQPPPNFIDPPIVLPDQPKIQIPKSKSPRPYQEKIINNWFQSNGMGVIQMATGTGKTITAISSAVTLFDKGGLEMLLVICPYKHLAIQWDEELREFNFNPILAYISAKLWR
ncbi:uncharacterized protein METZ01_LOCUS445777, partial [marine metagenome]